MNVVCHQAVAEQPYAVLPAPLRKCLEIESPVFVAQEDVLTIVAPLGDVVWNALHDHTGHPRHWNVRIIAEFGGCPSSPPHLPLISPHPLISSSSPSSPSSPPHLLLISSSSPPHLLLISSHLLIISSHLLISLISSSPSSPHLSLISLISHLISPHLSPHLSSSLTSSHLTSSHLISPHLHLISPHLPLISPHLTSSHLISPHLSSSPPHLSSSPPHLSSSPPHLPLISPHLSSSLIFSSLIFPIGAIRDRPRKNESAINRCPRFGAWSHLGHQQGKRVPSCEGFASGKLGVITLLREPRPVPNLFLRDRTERPRGEQSPPGFQVTPQAAGRAD